MSVEARFIEAARRRRLLWLTEPSGRYRIVEPYMVFRSSTGRRLLHFYQVGGYSAGSILRGWKNPDVHAFDGAEVLEETWQPRDEYNPFNYEMFPEVVYAVPTWDGRLREPDIAQESGGAGEQGGSGAEGQRESR
jgi:hypothetical protein